MITSKGRSIIGKYMIGQSPTYAAYIAVGCGANPKASFPETPLRFTSTQISSYQISGLTATVTTSIAHKLESGDKVKISFGDSRYDGTYTIIVTSATSFAYTVSSLIPTITALSWSTSLARYTTGTSAHNLRPGDRVTTAALGPAGYNNTDYVYSVPSATTFTIYEAADPGAITDQAGTVTLLNPPVIPVNATIEPQPFSLNKSSLDFEMFRVPITSRGLEFETGEDLVNKILFSANLSTRTDRYLITELGIFPSETNPIASGSDSRLLYTFSQGEGWEYHGSTTSAIGTGYVSTTATGLFQNIIGYSGTTFFDTVAFTRNSTDQVFQADFNKNANVKPRNLASFIAVRGGLSNLGDPASSTTEWVSTNQPHIHIKNQSFAFDNNSSSDELKLSFSVANVNPNANSAVSPLKLHLLVEFSSAGDETGTTTSYAKMQTTLSASDFANATGTRYFVATEALGDLIVGQSFSWESINLVKVYAQAIPPVTLDNTITAKKISSSGSVDLTLASTAKFTQGDIVEISTGDTRIDGKRQLTSVSGTTVSFRVAAGSAVDTTATGTIKFSGANFLVMLDGMRFENIYDAKLNPLYGMTAYLTVNDTDTLANTAGTPSVLVPVTKEENIDTMIEFKLNTELNLE